MKKSLIAVAAFLFLLILPTLAETFAEIIPPEAKNSLSLVDTVKSALVKEGIILSEAEKPEWEDDITFLFVYFICEENKISGIRLDFLFLVAGRVNIIRSEFSLDNDHVSDQVSDEILNNLRALEVLKLLLSPEPPPPEDDTDDMKLKEI